MGRVLAGGKRRRSVQPGAAGGTPGRPRRRPLGARGRGRLRAKASVGPGGLMDTQWPRYEVFEQERPDQPHHNAGAVHAPDAELALQNARDVFVRRPDCYSLWVAPASAIRSWTAEELAAGVPGDDLPDGDRQTAQTYLIFV